MEAYKDEIRKFRTVYSQALHCEAHRKTDSFVQRLYNIYDCSTCRERRAVYNPHSFLTWQWVHQWDKYVVCAYQTNRIEQLQMQPICSDCIGKLFEFACKYDRIVNPDWEAIVTPHLLPELSPVVYDYIFPELYCPECRRNDSMASMSSGSKSA